MVQATEPSPPSPDTEVLRQLLGTTLAGRYRLDELLSIGGTGAVYRAHQIALKRDVAVKVLHPELTRNERLYRRFLREAESVARLEHPNIVQVVEAGSGDRGLHFIVMQLVGGTELHARLGESFAPARAAELMRQVFCGLEHAHQRGVVHRDLKPENVLVTTDHDGRETIKLVDFGLAKLLEPEEGGEALTQLGLVFGTPAYMSPEQAAGHAVDHRSDLYSAGLIFYGLLAAQPPFWADDPVALMRAQVKEHPAPLPPGVPPELAALVFRLLEKRPEDRPRDASEVRARLEDMLPRLADADHASAAGRLRRRVAYGAGLAALIAVAILAARAGDGEDRGEKPGSGAEAVDDGGELEAGSSGGALPEPAATTTVGPAAPDGPTPGHGPDPQTRPAPPPAGPAATAPAASSPSRPKSSQKSVKSTKKKRKKSGFWDAFRRDDDR